MNPNESQLLVVFMTRWTENRENAGWQTLNADDIATTGMVKGRLMLHVGPSRTVSRREIMECS